MTVGSFGSADWLGHALFSFCETSWVWDVGFIFIILIDGSNFYFVSVNVSIHPSGLSGSWTHHDAPPPGFTAGSVFGVILSAFQTCALQHPKSSVLVSSDYILPVFHVCLNVVQQTLSSEHYLFSLKPFFLLTSGLPVALLRVSAPRRPFW